MAVEADREAIGAFSELLEGVTQEMDIIQIADMAKHGWLMVANLEKLLEMSNRKLLKMVLKVDMILTKKLSGRCRRSSHKWPFRRGSGGSAASGHQPPERPAQE